MTGCLDLFPNKSKDERPSKCSDEAKLARLAMGGCQSQIGVHYSMLLMFYHPVYSIIFQRI